MTPAKIRINVAGFAGAAVSLYCAFDPSTNVLLVARSSEYDGGPREDFIKGTNNHADAAFDLVFDRDHVREAIDAYFSMESMRLLTLGEQVQRHNPATKIERDGMDESGPKYRVAPDIGNGHVAVLLACLVARRQRAHASSLADFKDFELLSL